MRDEDRPVVAQDERPAGYKGECFYCRQKIGENHKDECVLLRKTVVLKTVIIHVVSVPRSWDRDSIEFQRNEGSWCSNNLINELEQMTTHGYCLCGVAKSEYLRDATCEDDDNSLQAAIEP